MHEAGGNYAGEYITEKNYVSFVYMLEKVFYEGVLVVLES